MSRIMLKLLSQIATLVVIHPLRRALSLSGVALATVLGCSAIDVTANQPGGF